ncbi:unnamed protein product [Symbiodinium natans]|uniref:Uncharacterized protein n=1 Tax=Symbiodinium natans TaxID=878477 RepID=A0A812T5A0_9DINO|nr:unnamed protein product [Symbiodinium natans]
MTPKQALRIFLDRYNCQRRGNFGFRHRWTSDGCVVTLVVPGFHDREFEGFSEGVRSPATQAASETAARVAFKADPDVNDARRRLPPTMLSLRKMYKFSSHQVRGLRELGYNPNSVLVDIAKSLHLGFRQLGCRTAMFDRDM